MAENGGEVGGGEVGGRGKGVIITSSEVRIESLSFSLALLFLEWRRRRNGEIKESSSRRAGRERERERERGLSPERMRGRGPDFFLAQADVMTASCVCSTVERRGELGGVPRRVSRSEAKESRPFFGL